MREMDTDKEISKGHNSNWTLAWIKGLGWGSAVSVVLLIILTQFILACGGKNLSDTEIKNREIPSQKNRRERSDDSTAPHRYNYESPNTSDRLDSRRPGKSHLEIELISGQAIQIQDGNLSQSNPSLLHLINHNEKLHFQTTSARDRIAFIANAKSTLNFENIKITDFPSGTSGDFQSSREVHVDQIYWIASYSAGAYIRSVVKITGVSTDKVQLKYKFLEKSQPTPLQHYKTVFSSDQILSGVASRGREKSVVENFGATHGPASSGQSLPLYTFDANQTPYLSVDGGWLPGIQGIAKLEFPNSLEQISDSEFLTNEGAFKTTESIELDAIYLIRLENLWEKTLIALRVTQVTEDQIHYVYKPILVQQFQENQWSND